MLKPKKIICFISILFFTFGAWAQKKEKALSLEDCILKAMENNLNVAVEVLNPELADISVSLAKENFLPSLTFGYSLQNTNSPSISFIEAEEKISAEYQARRDEFASYVEFLADRARESAWQQAVRARFSSTMSLAAMTSTPSTSAIARQCACAIPPAPIRPSFTVCMQFSSVVFG